MIILTFGHKGFVTSDGTFMLFNLFRNAVVAALAYTYDYEKCINALKHYSLTYSK